jgi:hypothetical protein
VRSNPTNLFILILFALLTARSGFAQEPPQQPCQEETPTFTGLPEQTLCEKYPNFNCEIQIGAGTPFPKSSLLGSSSLSGNVPPCLVFLKPSPRLLSEKTDLPAALGSFFDPAPLQQDSMLKYKPSGLPPELSSSLGLQSH